MQFDFLGLFLFFERQQKILNELPNRSSYSNYQEDWQCIG
jgi:hypothetical protein